MVDVLKTVLTWSVDLNTELEQGEYVLGKLTSGVFTILCFWSYGLTVFISRDFKHFLTLHLKCFNHQ